MRDVVVGEDILGIQLSDDWVDIVQVSGSIFVLKAHVVCPYYDGAVRWISFGA